MNRKRSWLRLLALPGVVLVHLLVLMSLARLAPSVHDRIETGTLTIRTIEPDRPPPPPLPPPPPPPKPVRPPEPPRERPVVPPPPVALVTAASTLPAVVVPDAPPVPVPVQAPPPPPVTLPGPVVPAPVPVRPTPPPPPPRPNPEPLVPPSFDAAYLQNPAPAYPSVSRRLGEEGVTVLQVLVEASGTAGQLEVRTSSGFPRLDDAALEAVRRWRFVPARQGDRTVAAQVLVPIRFTLGRGS